MTDLRSQGLLVIKLRCPGPLQSGELKEASSHEIAMSLWPPIFQHRMKPDNVSSQRPSLPCASLLIAAGQTGWVGGREISPFCRLRTEAQGHVTRGVAGPSLHPDLQNPCCSHILLTTQYGGAGGRSGQPPQCHSACPPTEHKVLGPEVHLRGSTYLSENPLQPD